MPEVGKSVAVARCVAAGVLCQLGRRGAGFRSGWPLCA
jgi:hypothetical protein